MAGQDDHYRKVRNFLLNPKFQLKFISYFIWLFILTTISLYSTNYLFFWKLKEKALKIGIPKGHVFFTFIENQKADLDHIFIALTVFNLLLLIGAGFVISHRIAGPLFKLKKFLQSCDSESEQFKLRDKDFFKDIEPVVNDLRDKLK